MRTKPGALRAITISQLDVIRICCAHTSPFESEVKKFWEIYGDEQCQPGKVTIHADSWGIRKLLSHVFRQMRLSRQPRDFRLQEFFTGARFFEERILYAG